MTNTIHTTETKSKKQVWINSCLAAALLLTIGCSMSQPLVRSSSIPTGQANRDAAHEAIEVCKAETVPSWRDTLKLFNDSTKTFSKVGREAGYLSDLANGSDTDTGADIGDAAGTVAGAIGALGAVTQVESTQKRAMRKCLEDRGYEVKGWG